MLFSLNRRCLTAIALNRPAATDANIANVSLRLCSLDGASKPARWTAEAFYRIQELHRWLSEIKARLKPAASEPLAELWAHCHRHFPLWSQGAKAVIADGNSNRTDQPAKDEAGKNAFPISRDPRRHR